MPNTPDVTCMSIGWSHFRHFRFRARLGHQTTRLRARRARPPSATSAARYPQPETSRDEPVGENKVELVFGLRVLAEHFGRALGRYQILSALPRSARGAGRRSPLDGTLIGSECITDQTDGYNSAWPMRWRYKLVQPVIRLGEGI